MTIYSMTGFGRGQVEARGVRVTVSLKSVNHKNLDCRLDMPPEFMELETEVLQLLRERLERGQVYGKVQIETCGLSRGGKVQLDEEMAGGYFAELRNFAAKLGLADDWTGQSLLALPQVVLHKNCLPPINEARRLLMSALEQALKSLRAMQAREGRALARDLRQRVRQLTAIWQQIQARAPLVPRDYQKKMQRRLAEAGLQSDDPLLARELAVFADRSDIQEELARARSHLQQLRAWLGDRKKEAGQTRCGRLLDFLVQELFREINTVGSKANDLAITQDVIQFKAELERVREQIQNFI